MGVGLIGEEGFEEGIPGRRTYNWTDWMEWIGLDWLRLWSWDAWDILSLAARLRKNDSPTYLPRQMEYLYI
jgi:hypothetical protein